MAKNAALSIDAAWNAVALEERIELISRANAQGLLAAFGCIALLGSVAYGFDKIWLLAASIPVALLVMPLFSSSCWRHNKAALILQYLAARSVARRYAYGLNVTDLDIILIFRGAMREIFASQEAEIIRKQDEEVSLDTPLNSDKEVWICLMRGALILMSERPGGAKLEFATAVNADISCTKPTPQDNAPDRAVIVTGSGVSKGRRVIINSQYAGAMYVFEKRLAHLIKESEQNRLALLELVEKRQR